MGFFLLKHKVLDIAQSETMKADGVTTIHSR